MKAIRPTMGKYQWFLHTPGTILGSIEPVRVHGDGHFHNVSPGYKDHAKDFFIDAEFKKNMAREERNLRSTEEVECIQTSKMKLNWSKFL